MKTVSHNIVSGILSGIVTMLGIVPLNLIAADAPAAEKTSQMEKAGWGTFVSFKDGTLTLKGNAGELVWNNITEKTKVFLSENSDLDKPSGIVGVLSKVEVGTWVFVAGNKTLIRVGAAKEGHITGTFVSFKNDRMLLLGKDLKPGNFTKKYGNQLNFGKFSESVAVFESIDGGDFTLAGTPATALPKIQEGTLVTVYYGQTDGSFVRIEIGVPKKN